MKSCEDLNKAEAKFVHIYTRHLLVRWAADTLRRGAFTTTEDEDLFLEYARQKKWVSKSAPPSVISGGFTSAAGFLK